MSTPQEYSTLRLFNFKVTPLSLLLWVGQPE